MPKRRLSSVKDGAPKKKPAVQLELGGPSKWRDKRVELAHIDATKLGSPPEPWLVKSVGIHGVILPVLLREKGDGTYEIIDGRQRVGAAIENELRSVPARVLITNGALITPATTIAGNARGPGNPIVELEAVEEIMRLAGQPTTAGLIAKSVGVPSKKVKDALAIANIDDRLRQAWLDGKFGTKVGVAAAKCDRVQQGRLLAILDENETLTLGDVKKVRKSDVSAHQRTLAGDRKYARAIESLEKARGDVVDELGDEHEAIQAIDSAIDALKAIAE